MKNYYPLFKNDGITTRERWLLIRKFIESWYDFEIPDANYADKIASLQDSLQTKLPIAIENFFVLAGQLQGMPYIYPNEQKGSRFSCIFRDCLDISVLEKFDAITLLIQAEQDLYWAIRKEDAGKENPEVYAYLLNYENDDNAFELYGLASPTVTSFVLNHILLYLGNCSSFGMTVKDPAILKDKLTTCLSNTIVYDGLELFEDENLIAFITKNLFEEDGFSFCLHVKENREIESLPVAVIDLVKDKKHDWTFNRFNQFS